jgi:hypothetical protein
MLLCITVATAVLLLQILARALGGSVGPNPDANFVLTPRLAHASVRHWGHCCFAAADPS